MDHSNVVPLTQEEPRDFDRISGRERDDVVSHQGVNHPLGFYRSSRQDPMWISPSYATSPTIPYGNAPTHGSHVNGGLVHMEVGNPYGLIHYDGAVAAGGVPEELYALAQQQIQPVIAPARAAWRWVLPSQRAVCIVQPAGYSSTLPTSSAPGTQGAGMRSQAPPVQFPAPMSVGISGFVRPADTYPVSVPDVVAGPLMGSGAIFGQRVIVPQPQAAPVRTPAPAVRSGARWAGVRKNADLRSAQAIDVKVPLPQCEIGAIELLAFFPNHTQVPEAGLRLIRNGWTHPDIAKGQLHARGRVSKARCTQRRNASRQQVITNGRTFFDDMNFAPTRQPWRMTPVASYDATRYQPRAGNGNAQPALLADVARGVVNWPTGPDAGIVTRVIRYAVQNQHLRLTTNDIPTIAGSLGYARSPEAALPNGNWDRNARNRLRAAVRAAGTYV